MDGIALQFNSSGAVQILPSLVEDQTCTSQNAVVNLLTEQGTDKIFPTRGTTVFQEAVSGGIISRQVATNVGNFAAINTLFFMAANEVAAATAFTLQNLNMQFNAVVASPQPTLSFLIVFTFQNGIQSSMLSVPTS